MKVKGKNGFILGIAIMFICGFTPAALFAESVTVYGEAAYTDSDIKVHIYVDTGALTHPLCSFGVKLTYPSDLTLDPNPAETGTDKTTWYIGSAPYTDVYTDTANEAVLIGGKLKIDNPGEGVSGTRKLLGTVRFTHSGATLPPTFGLSLGKDGSYKNFVCTDGTVLDDAPNQVVFQGITIAERGDADADGYLTNSDFFEIRNLMGSGTYKVYADCDGDGYLTNSDFICVRNNM